MAAFAGLVALAYSKADRPVTAMGFGALGFGLGVAIIFINDRGDLEWVTNLSMTASFIAIVGAGLHLVGLVN